MWKKTGFILGISGGLAGFIMTFAAVFYGTEDEMIYGESFMAGTSLIAMALSSVAITAASLIEKKPAAAGALLLITGLALPVMISTYGFVPLVLLVPAGLSVISRLKRK